MKATRRSFLGLSAASMALAGISSKAFAVPTGSPKKWDEAFDIVIVGAGGAGLAAGVVAVQKGLKTLIIEKEPFIGGSSALCGGKWAVADTDEQRAQGIKDSPELFLADMLKTGQNKNDPELVKAFIKASREHYEFMTKERGLKPIEIVAASGMSVPRAHNFRPAGVLNDMKKYVTEHGADLRLNVKAERLVWDDAHEAVAGVRASTKDGVRWFKARKGVLVAAGGFSKNKTLLEKYAPLMLRADATAGAGCTGDGMLMAQAYGADILDTQYIKATYGYRLDPNAPGACQVFYGGGILVNLDGKRFVNESLSYKLLGDAALAQKDGKSFIFFDEPLRKHRLKVRDGDRRLLSPYDEGKEVPYCFRADTIEEVAEKAGVNAKALKETVDRYNANVAKGEDPDFGRTTLTSDFGKPIELKTGPFYLYPATARLIATYCGVRIHPNAQVIDVFGDPIKHLYAAGEMTGGVHGAAYMTGSAWGKAMAFGRIAAASIANEAEI